MRQNNAQRVIYNFLSDGHYYEKKDTMRVKDGDIFDKNTRIGFFVEDELDGMWRKFLVLCERDFKSDKTWKKHKMALVKAANEEDIAVVFSSAFDIGLGRLTVNVNVKEACERMASVLGYSQLEFKKAACMYIERDIVYSVNQEINGHEESAEKILADFTKIFFESAPSKIICSIEPDAATLRTLIFTGAHAINFCHLHGAVLDTPEYVQITNNLAIREIKSPQWSNIPIKYWRIWNEKIESFYLRRTPGGVK